MHERRVCNDMETEPTMTHSCIIKQITDQDRDIDQEKNIYVNRDTL